MSEKEIYSITEANKALSESYGDLTNSLMIAANKSKAWNFVSRMTSGSGFWKIQNKIRAITDAYVVMNDNMKESIETQSKAAETMKKLREAKEKMGAMRTEDDGGFSIDKMKETEEFKSQIDAYKNVFGEEEGEDRLLDVISDQLTANETLFAELQATQEDALYYDSLGWRLDKKMAYKTRKYMKTVGNVVKMASRFFVQASIGMLLLILAIPVILAFAKNFKGILDSMGISVGIKDIKNAFKFVKKILTSFFEIFKKLFDGDIIGALKQYFFEIVVPIGKLLIKGVIKLVEIVAALFAALIKTIWNGVAGAINKAVPGKRFDIPKLARGGKIGRGGLAIVGEQGAELVSLPAGATVHSNTQSKQMTGGNTIHVHVNGRVGANDAEIRDIAQKVAREINLQMNRTTSAVGRF